MQPSKSVLRLSPILEYEKKKGRLMLKNHKCFLCNYDTLYMYTQG